MINQKYTDGILKAVQRVADIGFKAMWEKRATTFEERAELKEILGKLKVDSIRVANHDRQHKPRRTFINELAEFIKAAESLARKKGVIKPEAWHVLSDSRHLLANEIRLECARGMIHTSEIISADTILDAKRLLNETRIAIAQVGSEQCNRRAENVSLADALNDLYPVNSLVDGATATLYQLSTVFSDAVYFAVAAMTGKDVAEGFFNNPDATLEEWTDACGDWYQTHQLKALFDLAQRFKDGIPNTCDLHKINMALMLERNADVGAWLEKRRLAPDSNAGELVVRLSENAKGNAEPGKS